MVDYLKLFRMPTQVTITARSSSITNSFINGIAPTIEPTAKQVKDALNALGMEDGHIECAYCGDPCTEWDHLNPLVRNKMPTGYVTEINNLVPACGKCNQSKGNKPWREWMVSDAAQSPKSRGIADLDERMQLLSDYEELFTPLKIDFEGMLGREMWERYWKACDDLQDFMRQCQVLQDAASGIIRARLGEGPKGVSQAKSDADELEHRGATPSEPRSVHGNSKRALRDSGSKSGEKISDVVRARLIPAIQRLDGSDGLITNLEDGLYCRQMFGLNWPVLLPLSPGEDPSAAAKDHNLQNRYWVNPIFINGKPYLVCSQWRVRHWDSLESWLSARGW